MHHERTQQWKGRSVATDSEKVIKHQRMDAGEGIIKNLYPKSKKEIIDIGSSSGKAMGLRKII